MKVFSVAKISEPIKFQIDADEFEAIAPGQLPAGILAKYFDAINDGKLFLAHDEFFAAVLTEDSNKIFQDRLNNKENPITVAVLGDVAAWLLGDVYMGEVSGESKES